jgi:hypothetical protein
MRIHSRIVSKAATAILLLTLTSVSVGQPKDVQSPTPSLLADWIRATAGANAKLEEARRIAEAQRPKLPHFDPFTPLVRMTCPERLEKKERVVWEDGTAMALVDFGDRGSTLLVVPKAVVNFPVDLKPEEITYVSRVSAATCDALIIAAGQVPPTDGSSCSIYISPPHAIGVRQMHVHVEAKTGVAAPVDDSFLKRAGDHMRRLLGGSGCF